MAVIGKGRLCFGTLGILVVKLGLFQILLGESRDLKITAVVQRLDIVLGTVERGHRHARHLRSHDGALGRVVIGKDEAVRTKAQLCGDCLQIEILRLPVGLDSDKIIGTQDTVRVVKACDRVGLLVF